MAERIPVLLLIFLASHLFVSGVFSMSIIKIENKCNHTVWPVIYSWNSQVSLTGFTLKRGEARAIHAPSSWYGVISGRTYCSRDSARNFSCATGDCESGQIECPRLLYDWSHVTYVYFRIDNGGINSYTISVEHGYNLPIMVVPSERSTSPTCFSSGCMVDLNKTCPDNLKKYAEERLIGCSSACQEFHTPEDCCVNDYSSKQNCKPTLYTQNFGRACPLSHIYAYDDSNRTFTCTNSTDYVLTFCPSSIPETSRQVYVAKDIKTGEIVALKNIRMDNEKEGVCTSLDHEDASQQRQRRLGEDAHGELCGVRLDYVRSVMNEPTGHAVVLLQYDG